MNIIMPNYEQVLIGLEGKNMLNAISSTHHVGKFYPWMSCNEVTWQC